MYNDNADNDDDDDDCSNTRDPASADHTKGLTWMVNLELQRTFVQIICQVKHTWPTPVKLSTPDQRQVAIVTSLELDKFSGLPLRSISFGFHQKTIEINICIFCGSWKRTKVSND